MLPQFLTPILVTGTFSPTPGSTQDVNIVSQAITVAISAASLPLPTGAATEATLLAAKIDLDKFTFLSTRLLVDGSQVTQPISGSVSISNFPATQAVTQSTTPWIVDGSGFIQPVSGTIIANQGTSPWVVSGTIATSPDVNVHDGTGVSISSTGSSLNVDVTNTIPVTGPLTDAQLRATPVPISGTITANLGTIDGAATEATLADIEEDLDQFTFSATRLLVDNSGVTQPVSGTVTVTQATGTNLHTVVDNFPADADALAQGSTTSGQLGALIMAAVTTAAPTYITAQTNPLSLTTAGALRVDGSASTQPISGTITANQGTSPWVISGTVTATPTGTQDENLIKVAGVALGATAVTAYGTAPAAVNVPGVNAFITNTPAVTLASTTITGTVAVTQSTSPWVVSLASTTLTGTSTVAGNLTNNNAAPTSNNLGVLAALANAANPSWTEGDQVLLSEDLSGNLRVKVNTALPTGANVIGHVITDTGSTTAVTGNITVVQPTGANLNVAVSNFPADADALAQGSTTSGQLGALIMGAVTTSAPSYTTAQTSPLSLDTTGNLRVTGTVTSSGTSTVTGTKTNNNAAPGATNIGALPAVATAASPSYTEGNQVAESTDLIGRQRVRGTLTTNNAAPTSDMQGVLNAVANASAPSFTEGNLVTASVDLSGNTRVIGTKTNNNAAPGTQIGALTAVANAAAPTWTEGNQVLLSEDLAGTLRVSQPGMRVSSVEFTRPSNTTAYNTLSVVGTNPGAVLQFTNAARFNGGGGRIRGIWATKSTTNITSASFQIVFYKTAPTAINDGTAWTLLYADAAKYIQLAGLAFNAGGTGSNASIATNSTSATALDIPFLCDSSSTTLFGVLYTVAAGYTPGNAEKFFISLYIQPD